MGAIPHTGAAQQLGLNKRIFSNFTLARAGSSLLIQVWRRGAAQPRE